MIIVSQLLNTYYKLRLGSPAYRKKVFTLALQSKLRESRLGKVLIRNINDYMAAHPEVHAEAESFMNEMDYQKTFWSTDLGYIWFESNFRTSSIYFDYALEEILKNKCRSILDIGCGWGEFCAQCAVIQDVIKVTGIDISEEIIKNAQQKNPDTKAQYFCKTIFDIDESYDMITSFGAPDYIPPPDFVRVLEKSLSLLNKEMIILNSLRGILMEDCLKLDKAIEVKRYDSGYVHPLQYILQGMKNKYAFEFEIKKFSKDSQLAIIRK